MLSDFQKKSLRINVGQSFEPSDLPSIIKVFEFCTFDQIGKRSGRAFVVVCPFHEDGSPSLALYEDNNTYYCFACKESGNSFEMIKKIKGIDFVEAKQFAQENGLYK